MSEPSNERLQKVLADAGLASRREIERWIEAGRIEVNGATAITGQKVKAKDRIKVDGRLFTPARRTEPLRVLLYRKKVGEVVTRDDPEGRPTIFASCRIWSVAAGSRWADSTSTPLACCCSPTTASSPSG